MTLQEKVADALALLRSVADTYTPRRVAVAWTGGKDSTMVLHLWQTVLAALPGKPPLRALNLDTGHKFPQIVAFRDQLASAWQVELHVARPDVDLATYPVAADKVTCCRDLKVKPLLAGIRHMGIDVLLTGIRSDEHAQRAARPQREPHTTPDHVRIHPLLAFAEMDVWAYTAMYNVPYCELYTAGYRSLGCMPCTALVGAGGTERAGRDADKETSMASLQALGYF